MDIPHEAIANAGELRLTFVGTRDEEIIVETERMKDFFNVKPAGVTDGADPEPPTPTEYQKLMADIQGIRDGVAKAEGAVDDLYERAANGEFKGEKGDKGDPGDGGGTATDVRIAGESIVVDGVADIPFASSYNIGLVKPGTGLTAGNDGIIKIQDSNELGIDKRISRFPITAHNHDYAVKAAMCDGKGPAWTADEQKAARERMGAPAGYRFIADVTTDDKYVSDVFINFDHEGSTFRLSDALIVICSPPYSSNAPNSAKNGYLYIRESLDTVYTGMFYLSLIKLTDSHGYCMMHIHTFDGKCFAFGEGISATTDSIAKTSQSYITVGAPLVWVKHVESIRCGANGSFEPGTKFIVFGKDYQGGDE